MNKFSKKMQKIGEKTKDGLKKAKEIGAVGLEKTKELSVVGFKKTKEISTVGYEKTKEFSAVGFKKAKDAYLASYRVAGKGAQRVKKSIKETSNRDIFISGLFLTVLLIGAGVFYQLSLLNSRAQKLTPAATMVENFLTVPPPVEKNDTSTVSTDKNEREKNVQQISNIECDIEENEVVELTSEQTRRIELLRNQNFTSMHIWETKNKRLGVAEAELDVRVKRASEQQAVINDPNTEPQVRHNFTLGMISLNNAMEKQDVIVQGIRREMLALQNQIERRTQLIEDIVKQ